MSHCPFVQAMLVGFARWDATERKPTWNIIVSIFHRSSSSNRQRWAWQRVQTEELHGSFDWSLDMHSWCGRVAWKCVHGEKSFHVIHWLPPNCSYPGRQASCIVHILKFAFVCRVIVTLIIIIIIISISIIISIIIVIIIVIFIGPSLSSFSSSFTSFSSSPSHRQSSGEASQDWCWMESQESGSQATKRVAGDASVPRLTRKGQTVSRFAKGQLL